jgi:hypothetical protein
MLQNVTQGEGKRPLGRSRRSQEYKTRIGLRDIGWEGVNWIHLAQKRDLWRALVNTVMNFRFPYKAEIS